MPPGRPVFRGATVIEVCGHHMHTEPEPPSLHAKGLSKELEDVVLACLAKQQSARPVSAKTLRRLLQQVPLAKAWTEEAAHEWWNVFDESPRSLKLKPLTGTNTLQVDLHDREVRLKETVL